VNLKSIPSFFLTDDHDEFENDEFTDDLATMPSSEFGLDGEDATQFMYYPEFLPDAGRPDYLWGSKKIARTLVNPWDRESSTKARRFAARCSAFALPLPRPACCRPACP
jgi:hypothetical protein